MTLEALKCPSCGSSEIKAAEDGTYDCNYCDTKSIYPVKVLAIPADNAQVIKPFHFKDLRKMMRERPGIRIDQLNDVEWVAEMTEVELLELVKVGTDRLLLQIGKNTRIDMIMEELARDDTHGIRRAVASNPNAPEDLLIALSKDEYCVIDVAENPNSPAELLGSLVFHSRDESVESRKENLHSALIRNPKLPRHILWDLTGIVSEKHLPHILCKPNVDPQIIDMVLDRVSGLKLGSVWNSNLAREMGRLAENPNTPVPVLNKLILMARAADIKGQLTYRGRLIKEMKDHPFYALTDWTPYAGWFPSEEELAEAANDYSSEISPDKRLGCGGLVVRGLILFFVAFIAMAIFIIRTDH
jgi:hypothetical protein